MQPSFSFLHTLGQEEGRKKSRVQGELGKHLASPKMERSELLEDGLPCISADSRSRWLRTEDDFKTGPTLGGRGSSVKPTQRSGFFTGSQHLLDKSNMSNSTATVQAATPCHARSGRESGDGRGAAMGGGADSRPQTQANARCVLPRQHPAPDEFLPEFLRESPAEELGQGCVPGPTWGPLTTSPTLSHITFLESAIVPSFSDPGKNTKLG